MKWWSSTKKAVGVLTCYLLVWPFTEYGVFCIVCLLPQASLLGVGDFLAMFLGRVFGLFQIPTLLAALAFCGLHLPLLLPAAFALRKVPPRWTLLASVAIAVSLAPFHWVYFNFIDHGYDTTCQPDSGLIGEECGLPPFTRFSYALADVLTAFLPALVLTGRATRGEEARVQASLGTTEDAVWPPPPRGR